MPENAYRRGHLWSHWAAGAPPCPERAGLDQHSPAGGRPCQALCTRVTARRDAEGMAWCGGRLPDVVAGLAVLLVVALALTGCPRPAPTPTAGPVQPGAACSPRGAEGVAADGTPMRCAGMRRPVWRMAVRDR